MNPISTEYSQTGGGDEAAAQNSTAFDPSETDPERQTQKAGGKSGDEADNPLNVSPGNPEANPTNEKANQEPVRSEREEKGERKVSTGKNTPEQKGGS